MLSVAFVFGNGGAGHSGRSGSRAGWGGALVCLLGAAGPSGRSGSPVPCRRTFALDFRAKASLGCRLRYAIHGCACLQRRLPGHRRPLLTS